MTTKLDELVNRFLTWPVPADVYPDGTPGQPGRSGTNLLTAQQAKDMLTHVLGDVLAEAAKSDPSHMHEALDALRKRLDSGEIVAFVAAAINTEDGVYAYCGADKAAHVTRLRMQGALAQIQHAYLNGELVEGDTV